MAAASSGRAWWRSGSFAMPWPPGSSCDGPRGGNAVTGILPRRLRSTGLRPPVSRGTAAEAAVGEGTPGPRLRCRRPPCCRRQGQRPPHRVRLRHRRRLSVRGVALGRTQRQSGVGGSAVRTGMAQRGHPAAGPRLPRASGRMPAPPPRLVDRGRHARRHVATNRFFSTQFSLFVVAAATILLAPNDLSEIRVVIVVAAMAVATVMNYAVFPGPSCLVRSGGGVSSPSVCSSSSLPDTPSAGS